MIPIAIATVLGLTPFLLVGGRLLQMVAASERPSSRRR
jgi:hypothetical protein